MEWYYILTAVGIPTIISGAVAMAINRAMAKRDARVGAKQEELRKQSEVMEQQNTALMLGIQAILRDRLLQGYRHYSAKGWADYDDRQNMENMYTQYHALGANGVMDGYRLKFLQLPEYNPADVALRNEN